MTSELCNANPADERFTTGWDEGSGASFGYGSDMYPYTVVGWNRSGREMTVRGDSYKGDLAGGHDYYGNQVYTFSPNPHGQEMVFTLRRDGRWLPKGVPGGRQHRGGGLLPGRACRIDPHY